MLFRSSIVLALVCMLGYISYVSFLLLYLQIIFVFTNEVDLCFWCLDLIVNFVHFGNKISHLVDYYSDVFLREMLEILLM